MREFIAVFLNILKPYLDRRNHSERRHPMIELRTFDSLGAANHGWLDACHHFSFADYRDPSRVNWGRLRVWHDDRIAEGSGFPPHPHNDMEIITSVPSGATKIGRATWRERV